MLGNSYAKLQMMMIMDGEKRPFSGTSCSEGV